MLGRPGVYPRILLPFVMILLPVVAITPGHADDKPPVSVTVQPVHYQNDSVPVRTSGVLRWKSRQTLAFKTAGPVATVLVDAGDRMIKGQRLANLVPDEIDAQLSAASARVALARNNLQRMQQLHNRNALSLDQLQSAETGLAIARSQLRMARFNQTYASIDAPANGLVLQRHVEAGELVAPHQPVLLVADESKGWIIRTSVTDRNIVRIAPGDKVSIYFDALAEQRFTGIITRTTAMASSAGTFAVEISLSTANPLLRSGFVAQLEIQPAHSRKRALIPISALIQSPVDDQPNSARVLIFNSEQQTAISRTVTLDYLDGTMAAISQGLKAGELLITTGAGLLKHGDRVHVVNADTAGGLSDP